MPHVPRAEQRGLAYVKTYCLCGTMLPDHLDSLEVGMASPDVYSERGWTLFNPSPRGQYAHEAAQAQTGVTEAYTSIPVEMLSPRGAGQALEYLWGSASFLLI